MPARRNTRRNADPGLQPERTSLAWFRTLSSCGVLMTLALRHHREISGVPFWSVMSILFSIWLLLCCYSRRRGKWEGSRPDFAGQPAQRAKQGITLAVMVLALLFCIGHILQFIADGRLK